jgi:hypothetical protein
MRVELSRKPICTPVFGVCEKKPLCFFPSGRAKIRMRDEDFIRVFIKSKNGIRQFLVKECGDYWEPFCEQSANYREVIE